MDGCVELVMVRHSAGLLRKCGCCRKDVGRAMKLGLNLVEEWVGGSQIQPATLEHVSLFELHTMLLIVSPR